MQPLHDGLPRKGSDMFPNLFLTTFWQMDLKPQIFVAMSFAEPYKRRFDEVIAPAIRGIQLNYFPLLPYRVDFSKSGDSILTDIMDGIAHSQMVLADVSVIGNDSRSGQPYRNGNVMYEVGLAVACRQPTEILLIRDDQEKFLFDTSTIPHIHLDFAKPEQARQELQERLIERLRERNFLLDARVKKAVSSLTSDELVVIKRFASQPPSAAWGFPQDGSVNFLALAAIPRLLDKNLIKLVGTWTEGGGSYQWTPLGYTVAQLALSGLPQFAGIKMPPPEQVAPSPTQQKDSEGQSLPAAPSQSNPTA